MRRRNPRRAAFPQTAPPLSALGVRAPGYRQPAQAERAAAWQAIAGGEADLAFGTHALFQEAGSFQRLGLAVVTSSTVSASPAAGADAESMEPHQLMMSATPIPRTLAMSFFSDLDVSAIDELPPGRTRLSPSWSVPRAATTCWRGWRTLPRRRQAYWVAH